MTPREQGWQDIASVLERAADLIEPEGAWIKDELARDECGSALSVAHIGCATCFCAAGALWRAARPLGEPRATDVVLAAFDVMRKLIQPYSGVGSWNDAPGRTQAEVVAKLREAAKAAREAAR